MNGALHEPGSASALPVIGAWPDAWATRRVRPADAVTLRPAHPGDREALRAMQALAMRVLGAGYYTADQIESVLAHMGTMDDFLLREGTYYLAEASGAVVASGGWSRRKPGYAAMFEAAGIAPGASTATIRSVFVHPDWAGRGLARRLAVQAETSARAAGHREVVLTATLSGEPLYRRLGYEAGNCIELRLPDGVAIGVVPMRKLLVASASAAHGGVAPGNIIRPPSA